MKMKLLRNKLLGVIVACVISIVMVDCLYAADQKYSIHINRKDKLFYVIDNKDNKVIYHVPCGIGKGGLNRKKSMSDYVTPTGEFYVDVILNKDNKYNSIASGNVDKHGRDKRYSELVLSRAGLAQLFKNMNNIDFDYNGMPDRAYGVAYIGLESDGAVTGPKMKTYGNTLYWYSIAIHGTPDETNVGRAKSGGCVHLAARDLSWLIDNNIVRIGTRVTISDKDPVGVSYRAPPKTTLMSLRGA